MERKRRKRRRKKKKKKRRRRRRRRNGPISERTNKEKHIVELEDNNETFSLFA